MALDWFAELERSTADDVSAGSCSDESGGRYWIDAARHH